MSQLNITQLLGLISNKYLKVMWNQSLKRDIYQPLINETNPILYATSNISQGAGCFNAAMAERASHTAKRLQNLVKLFGFERMEEFVGFQWYLGSWIWMGFSWDLKWFKRMLVRYFIAFQWELMLGIFTNHKHVHRNDATTTGYNY